MLKIEELLNPESCLNRARSNERIFVLLGRDVAAPAAIRAWARERVALGKNEWSDAQIYEALYCCERMYPPIPETADQVVKQTAFELFQRALTLLNDAHNAALQKCADHGIHLHLVPVKEEWWLEEARKALAKR